MTILEPIDNYCERMDASWLAEPLNFLSNISFFIAAYYLYRLSKSSPHPVHARLLILLVTMVGIGSSLFHSIANHLTMLGDIIPIALFVLTYLWLAMRWLAGFHRARAAIGIALFLLAAYGTGFIPDPYRLNGSVAYLPCLLALFTLAVATVPSNRQAARLLFYATDLFIVSLTLRSVDMVWCAQFPIGTHLGWHLLNGFVLYLLGKALLLFNCKPAQKV